MEAALEEIKNQAYLIYSEWGPDLLTPREKRLADCFPQIEDELRARWMAEFELIDSEIGKAAELGLERNTFESFKQRMLASFPFINQAVLDRAWFLAQYYAWHDGYL